jgi:hypothetical protein
MTDPALTSKQLLAADTFGYSYANYADHLGIGNDRFDRLMPGDIETLQAYEKNGWDNQKLARVLGVNPDEAQHILNKYQLAEQIHSTDNAAESFRIAVTQSINSSLAEGLKTPDDVESLARQICCRAADLAYLLELEGKQLSDYSEALRD